MQAPITHIEVISANRGAEVYGLSDGMLVKVIKETPKFFFLKAPKDGHAELKVSKKTNRCCHWANQNSSPLFNI